MTPSTATPTRRERLTKTRIIDAAMAIATVDGLEGLSMRRLAVDLDVSTMAAYRHVTSREELERELVARVIDEVMTIHPSSTGDWKGWIRVLTDRSYWRIRAVPGLAQVIQREISPTTTADLVLATWVDAFTAQAVRRRPNYRDAAAERGPDARHVRARTFATAVVWLILASAATPDDDSRAYVALEGSLELLLDGYDR